MNRINLKKIIEFIDNNFENVKKINTEKEIYISKVTNQLMNSDEESLLWINEKNNHKIFEIKSGTVICSLNTETSENENLAIVKVENPRLVFSKVLAKFFVETKKHVINSNNDTDIKLGENVNIGKNTVLENGVIVGKNTFIGNNNVILQNTIIGENVIIGHNNTIGGVGFGYEKNEKGDYELIPHIGNVIIEDNVEIGSNNCIDRAVLGSTVLKKNCKIDNLVHIAHGVEIGENSLIIANSMIAGSVKIGENTWIAPSTSIINKSSVGSNSMTGIGTVVIKNISDNELHVGVPSKKIKDI